MTHNDAIAGFTNQSLGLRAYECKTGSSTATKLALETCHFKLKNLKFSGEGQSTLPQAAKLPPQAPLPVGRDTPSHTNPLGAPYVALDMIRPPLFKPWIRPCFQRTYLCDYLETCVFVGRYTGAYSACIAMLSRHCF